MELKFKLPYSYWGQIWYVTMFIFIFLSIVQDSPGLAVSVIIIGIFLLYFSVKTIAYIELDELKLHLVYRLFFRNEKFTYSISSIEKISIYYSWKRYHSTIMFIKLKNSDSTIKHTAEMSLSNAKKLVEVFRNLNVNVIELEWPKVEGKVITLP